MMRLYSGSRWLARFRLAMFLGLTAMLFGLAWSGDAFFAAHGQEPVESLEESPAAGAPPVAGPSEQPVQPRSIFNTMWDGGWIALVILLLSVVAVGFMVEHAMTIRKSVLMPERVLSDLEQLVAQNQLKEAIEYCHQPENYSLASNVILAGLERYQGSDFGFADYRTAVEEEGENQTAALYRKTEVLGLIGTIAPMLGLLGTVSGMITSFNTIAARQGAARPDELAGGIGEALITTLFGLFVAIPAMVAFSYFRNKIDSLVAEAGKRVEHILLPLGRQKK